MLGGLVALAGAAGVGGLAGCSTPESPGGTSSTGGGGGGTGLTLPALVPYADVKPDLDGDASGVPQGFFSYPATPARREGFPLTGIAPVSGFFQANKDMAPRDANPWWQGIEAGIGTRFDASTISSTVYTEKYQTMMAGNDLPDLMQMVPVAKFPALLDAKFADLTPHLSGDAVKDYPGLASIPTNTWKLAVVGGKIRGVAQPRPAGGRVVSYRGDLWAAMGIDQTPELKNGEDFLALCRQVSDPAKNVFAMGAAPTNWALYVVLEMMGAPNTWAEEGGKFTHIYEAPQMKDALEVVKQMMTDKILHPESVSQPANNIVWWTAGTTSMYIQDFAGWPLYARTYPDWKLGALTLPKWDGGGNAVKHLGNPGYSAFVAIKKADDKRVADLLRVLDYVASPFGTQQYLDMNFGAAGVDYNLVKGNPVTTKDYDKHWPQGLQYAGAQAFAALYNPTDSDQVKSQHAWLSALMPTGVANASQGLYSEAAVGSGAVAARALTDVQTAIIQGARPVSDYDEALKQWQTTSGNQQRTELEAALQQQGGR